MAHEYAFSETCKQPRISVKKEFQVPAMTFSNSLEVIDISDDDDDLQVLTNQVIQLTANLPQSLENQSRVEVQPSTSSQIPAEQPLFRSIDTTASQQGMSGLTYPLSLLPEDQYILQPL